MGMKKPVGLTLAILNRNLNIRVHKPRKRKPRMQQTTITKLESLEKWFLSDYRNPSPTSKVAELMRELLEKNPDLSIEQVHQLARSSIARPLSGMI
jgi:hypothetical protein